MKPVDRSTWQPMKFSDMATSVGQRAEPTPDDTERYVGLEHLQSGSLTVPEWGSRTDLIGTKLRMQEGDVLFARRNAYLRRVAVAPHDGLFSAHGMVLRARPEVIRPRFLAPFMASDIFMDRAVRISVGSLSPTVNWKTLAEQKFDVPPLEQQDKIADLLWGLDDEIKSVSKAIEATETTRQALLRQALESHPEWRLKSVRSILREPVRNGLSAKANDQGRGTPTVSISAVRDESLRIEQNLKYVVLPETVDIDGFRVRPGDFFVVRGNGNKSLVGLGGLARTSPPDDCIYPDLLIRLRVDPEQVLPDLFPALWNEAGAHAALLRHAKSTNGIWKINGADVSQHQLRIPPIPEQATLLRRTDELRAMANSLRQRVDASIRLRSAVSKELIG